MFACVSSFFFLTAFARQSALVAFGVVTEFFWLTILFWARDRLLKREIDGMDVRQAPLPDGRAPPSTLIAVLRRTLAAQTGCPVQACVEKMWEIVSGMEWHGNDGGGVMARVVRG